MNKAAPKISDESATPPQSLPSQTQNAGGAPRLEFIDGLRALAMLQVLLFHCWVFGGQWHLNVPIGHHQINLFSIFSVGHIGVSLFLVLSGFCLYWPFVKGGKRREMTLKEFAYKRCRRILPPYYIALLLFAGWDAFQITGGHMHEGWAQFGRSIGLHLAMLHNMRPQYFYDINGAFWSLALESQLYVIFPLLVEAGRRFGMRRTLLAALAVSLAFRLAAVAAGGFHDNEWVGILTYSVFGRFPEFAFGMFAASLVASSQGIRALTRLDYAVAVAIVLASVGGHKFGSMEVGKAALSGLAFTVLLLIASRADNPLHRLLSSRLMVRLGVMSYSVYLVHQPLALAFGSFAASHGFTNIENVAFQFLLVIPFLLFLGYLFHLAFERPFLTTRARSQIKQELVNLSNVPPAAVPAQAGK